MGGATIRAIASLREIDMPDLGRIFRAAVATAVLGTAALAAQAADRFWPPIVDPPTGQHTPGRWIWADLVTADVALAADFYGKVFGWTFETYGGENDLETYTLVLADGLPIGGMVFDQRALKDEVPTARWVALASVADVPAAAKAVTDGGGKVVYAPVMLGERGETAVFQDPEGALFGVVRSKHGDPADYFADLNEWVWLDLWTADVERAAKFYGAVIGYAVLPLADDNPSQGVHLVSGGFVRAGVMHKEDERLSTTWLPYVRVVDAKAAVEKARAAGGKVLREPVGMKRAIVAIVADPTGAPVGIAQLPDPEASR
jgi:predicted enzyme related to lactoylglutathione lyase